MYCPHPLAKPTLLQYYCTTTAQYTPSHRPPFHMPYTIHRMVMSVSCKGQAESSELSPERYDGAWASGPAGVTNFSVGLFSSMQLCESPRPCSVCGSPRLCRRREHRLIGARVSRWREERFGRARCLTLRYSLLLSVWVDPSAGVSMCRFIALYGMSLHVEID